MAECISLDLSTKERGNDDFGVNDGTDSFKSRDDDGANNFEQRATVVQTAKEGGLGRE